MVRLSNLQASSLLTAQATYDTILNVLIQSIVILTITLAFWLEASIGFGGGLVSVPILAVFLTTSQAITLVLLFQFMKGSLIFFNWKKVDWKIFRKISIGVILGCILGVLLQSHLPHKIISFLLGVFILLYVFRTHLTSHLGQKTIKQLPQSIIGIFAGLIQGGFGIGGPVFVMYYNETIEDKIILRATLIATFLLCNSIRLAVSIPAGLLTQQVITLACYAFIPFVLALYLGQKYHSKIKNDIFQKIIDVLLFLSALSLLSKVFL